MSDAQLRLLEERWHYLRELEEHRVVILKSIKEQGKLSPKLAQAIESTESKARLKDFYLSYRPRRRTKAQVARKIGLTLLANSLLASP